MGIHDYLTKELLLPNWWWGPKIAKQYYGSKWKSGYQVVTLLSYCPPVNNEVEALHFRAEDGDLYKIDKLELDKYWSEKRFAGTLHLYVNIPLCFLCCCCMY